MDYSLPSAIDWLARLLTGSIGTAACVIGVAVFGALMLSGNVPVRRGLEAIIGCFIILSAANVATAFLPSEAADIALSTPVPPAPAPPTRTPPADPYAFASVLR